MLVFYITAHGYGHGARACDILSAYLKLPNRPRLVIVTDLPEDFLRVRLPAEGWVLRRGAFDVGMVQRDSVRVDVPATLERVERLLAQRPALIDQEKRFLASGAGLVAGDIPAIPFEAAADLGVPTVALGNFGWDWIYSAFSERDARWPRVADQFRQAYSRVDLLLRMPFSESMDAFTKQEPIPVVASAGRSDRARLARLTGADEGRLWVLLSFTTLELSAGALERLSRLVDFEFFTVPPLGWDLPNFRSADTAKFRFSDLVATVDVVLSKPGFGILSDTVANDKPLVYVERQDFLEYPLLERAIHRYLRHQHLPVQSLYEGRVGSTLLEAVRAPAPPERLSSGGAVQVAERLRELCTGA